MNDRTETFDYVIVGGGNAGCVLANRLTTSGQHSVALLEAGGEGKGFWIDIPAGFSKLLVDDVFNWRFWTEPEEATLNRRIAIPRGKGLGGSTLINGMIYVRGQRQDYDGWAQRGCLGWSFADVVPYFRKIESFDGLPDNSRGTSGPLPITTVGLRPAIAEAFITAAMEAGHPRNPDYNAASQDGFGYYQVNQRNGRRVSAAEAYLKPARGRANLAVHTNTRATRIILEKGRASGVIAETPGGRTRFIARAAVILTAGSIQTPQLLELSGIGNPILLKQAGIEPVIAAPEVGENYIDHFCTRMNWRVTRPVTLNEQTRGLPLVQAVAQYFTKRTGILTLGTGLVHGFVRTRSDLEGPDVQYFFMHASYANAAERILDRQPGMTLGVTQLRPESKGSVHIIAPEITTAPVIRPNFLATETDRQTLVDGMKAARHIVTQRAMDAYRGAELNPGPVCETDADWLRFAQKDGQTIYHACGTARMGSDPGAIVDPTLRLRGLDGLYIADASVMPAIVSANTQAAVFMIAEKAADLILAAAR